MTVYALRLQNSTDTAARARMADLLGLAPGGNLSARAGLRPGPTAGDVAVTAGTMQVVVQPFVAFVDGSVSDAQGGYPFVSDAAVTLTLANGHGSLSRTDVVAAVVRDSGYDTSGTVSATVEVVQGTPGAGVPALPASAVPLRNIVVPAGASAGTGGLTSGALSTDRRAWLAALGGVIPVASQTERDTLPALVPTLVYRKDTNELELRRASGWQRIRPATDFIKGATVDGTTSLGGDIAVTFATPFANTCQSVTITQAGSPGFLGPVSIRLVADPTPSGFTCRVYDGNGDPLVSVAGVRFGYTAVGN